MIHFYREIQEWADCCLNVTGSSFRRKKSHFLREQKKRFIFRNFNLYLNLTKPTKFLFLSWAKVSGEGKSLRPSYLIQELMRLFPNLKPVDEEEKSWQQCEMTRRTGILRLAEGLREKEQGLDAQWKELYTWFAGDEKSRSVVEKLLRAGFYKKKPVCWEVRWLKSCILILNA